MCVMSTAPRRVASSRMLFKRRRAGAPAASSTRRAAARASGTIETKSAGDAGARQDNHSPSPR
ncbi:hypothetical protein CWD92_00535 [Burkholderia thailandensis]|nr:hypothetical protein A8H32_12030 [Burkholderia thailandensis]PJO73872.1 hypothetical protein CWD92_00535 [Burkholderia thailandensis]PNE74246.1 hypothetical protein A8H37_20660 [Burkholderia thailandensis]